MSILSKLDFLTRLKFLFYPERVARDITIAEVKLLKAVDIDENEFLKLIQKRAKNGSFSKATSEKYGAPKVVHYYSSQGVLIGMSVRWPNRTYYYTAEC